MKMSLILLLFIYINSVAASDNSEILRIDGARIINIAATQKCVSKSELWKTCDWCTTDPERRVAWTLNTRGEGIIGVELKDRKIFFNDFTGHGVVNHKTSDVPSPQEEHYLLGCELAKRDTLKNQGKLILMLNSIAQNDVLMSPSGCSKNVLDVMVDSSGAVLSFNEKTIQTSCR